MKTLVKLLIAGVMLVVVLVVVGAVVAFNYIDAIVEGQIEKSGTRTLGVETSVDSADVGIFSGTFEMEGLTVANPDGYATPYFMRLPSAGVDVALDTVRSDVIEVPVLTVGKIEANLDGSGGRPNASVILENVERDESAPDRGGEEGKKFIIGSLVLEGASVRVAGFPGMEVVTGDVTVDVPRIELRDVGSAEPLTAGELISLVVKTVLSTTIENGGGVLPADLVGSIRDRLAGLEGLGDMGITAVGDVGAIGEQLQKKADEAIEDVKGKVGDAIGDLLGGGGEKDEDDGGP